MLTISPLNTYKKNNVFQNRAKNLNQPSDNYDSTPTMMHSYTNIAFQGYGPSPKNRYYINKIVNLVKDDDNQRIAIFPHKSPDGDAIGSALGLAHIIQQATGKVADIFVCHPLDGNLKIIDAKSEIKVISDMLGPKATTEEIANTFGKYDIAIGVDNPDIDVFEDGFYESLFNTATHTIKIDHHPAGKGNKNRNYAQINLIDLTKESAAQLVMEFVKPFGLNPKKISSVISDPITMGLLSDSQQFKYPRNPGIFKDAAELSKTSNFEKIIKSFEKIEKEDLQGCIKILNTVQLANDGKIAYCIVDLDKDEISGGHSIGKALTEISKIKGVNYYFIMKKKSNEIKVSVRSSGEKIRAKMLELGGDGHDYACGLKFTDKTIEEATTAIIEKLTELDKN